MDEKIKKLVQESKEAVVALRRYFHTYPELSGQEFNTQRKVMAELSALGLKPRVAAKTGVIADLVGGRPGRMVAVRADMDALLLQDDCDTPYRSINHGICHACGHDGHMAMAIGVAGVLSALKDELAGTVRFIFQPCEETFPGGAAALIEEGALDGVDYIIGAHLWQPLAVGTIGVNQGRMMAAPDEFTITVKGRGGHGSMPHQTVDSLFVGAQIVVALNSIISRSVDPLEPAVLSLGMFKSGEVFNVIPDSAVMKGTVRSFERDVREKILNRIKQVADGICQASGAHCEISTALGHPPVINNPEIAAMVAEAGSETLGASGVIENKPVMSGEDFSFYQERVPGAFVFIGAGNAEKGIVYPHHHPKFDIDEAALGYGVEIMTRSALKLLSRM